MVGALVLLAGRGDTRSLEQEGAYLGAHLVRVGVGVRIGVRARVRVRVSGQGQG